jgi:hypothetical protein
MAERTLLYVRMLFMAEIEGNIRRLCCRLCRPLSGTLRENTMGQNQHGHCHLCQIEKEFAVSDLRAYPPASSHRGSLMFGTTRYVDSLA